MRSFLAALSCDDPAREYESLAEALKRDRGATLDAWLLARQEIRAELGRAADLAWRLEPLGPGREEAGGAVLQWWGRNGKPLVGFLLVPQHYLDLTLADGRHAGTFLDRPVAAWLALEGRQLRLELQDPVLRGVRPEEVRALVLATEWKIRDVLQPGGAGLAGARRIEP